MTQSRNNARYGGGFIKFIIMVGLLATVVVLGWGVFANWNLDADDDGKADGFTLRVLDPAWWSASKEEAEPWVERGRAFALEQKEEIWGDDGWVDQGEDWLAEFRARRESAQAATPETAVSESSEQSVTAIAPTSQTTTSTSGSSAPVPAEPTKSPRTTRLEERIHNAEDHFADGLKHYRAADPANGGWTDARANSAVEARDHFKHVRELLQDQGTLDEYSALDDHDPRLLKSAQELLQLNQKLLYAATKSSGGI